MPGLAATQSELEFPKHPGLILDESQYAFHKTPVRPRVQVKGWECPPGNLLEVYLKACEKSNVSANSGVATKLLRRVRVMQPVPHHLELGLSTRQDYLDLLRHSTPLDSDGNISKRVADFILRMLQPRMSWEDARAQVPWATFEAVLQGMVSGLSDQELAHGVLELLVVPLGMGSRDVDGLVAAIFSYYDAGGQGYVTADEVRAIVGHLGTGLDMQQLAAEHPALTWPHDGKVDMDTFRSVLLAVLTLQGMSRDKLEIVASQVIEYKLRDGYSHDFSRDFVGPAGLGPLIEALRHDDAFTSLSLANCGLYDTAACQLEEWLSSHPRLTALDLRNNRIGDRGGMALARLLAANPRITQLDIAGNHLLRHHSRTHHDALGPAPCEDAVPVLRALALNCEARRGSSREVVRLLRQHQTELKAMVYALADGKGKVTLPDLQTALSDVVLQWGFTQEALDEVVQSERLLGTTGAAVRRMDASGRLLMTYEELLNFLRWDEQVVRVMHAVRHHRPEVKAAFYTLPAELPPQAEAEGSRASVSSGNGTSATAATGGDQGDGMLPAVTAEGSAPSSATAATDANSGKTVDAERQQGNEEQSFTWPLVRLSMLQAAIKAMASEPGSGWDVTLGDLDAVLVPGVFLQHRPPSRSHEIVEVPEVVVAAAPLGGEAAFLLAEEDEDGGPGQQSLRATGAGHGSDLLISWPAFHDTCMYLFNR